MSRFVKLFAHQARTNFIRAMTSSANVEKHNMNRSYYVWIDMEMTGLDEKVHKVVEVACIITNEQLNALHDGIHFVVHQPKEVFDNGHEWTKINFPKSGLMEESLNSTLSIEKVDELLSEYIKNQTNYKENAGTYHLAGNSVYMDKRFLEKYLVRVNELLHYRIIDVSTIKTLCCHWYPEIFKSLEDKSYKHRALSDIRESINELKRYREKIFLPIK